LTNEKVIRGKRNLNAKTPPDRTPTRSSFTYL